MIEKIVGAAESHRGLTVTLVAAFAVIAVVLGSEVRFDALPDITTNQVIVLTRAPGFTPEEVEQRVSRQLEAVLGGLPGLESQRSISRYGISAVTAVFSDDTDPFLARQVVQERVNTVEMPAGVESPELAPYTGGLGEVYHFTLSSPVRTPAELTEIATLTVTPILRSVHGVVEVNTWGGASRTLDVVADPVRMARHGVTLEELAGALRRATGTAPGASIETGPGQSLLRAVALPRGSDDLAGAIVRPPRDAGPAIRVGDVASVVPGEEPKIGDATANGGGRTVYVMVQMLRDANALEVVHGIEARMDDVREVVPDDVRVSLIYDRSHLVEATLRTVFTNLVEGGLLVTVVLFLMLGSFRAGLLVALTIPLSMLGAAVGMAALGIPGNLMSLGAIDFGLLVDGAVVMVESIFHRFAVGSAEGDIVEAGDRRATIRTVVREMARPVFYSVLIITLVYVPVITLEGVDGRMFRPMALTVVLALLTSLVLSMTFIPAAASFILRAKDVPTKDPWLVRGATRAYEPMLAFATKRPIVIAAVAVALLAGGLVLFGRAGSELVPQLDEGDLVIQTQRASDIRVETAVDEATRMEAAMLEHVPEVRQVVSRIGSPAVATDIMGLEQADVFVALAPREEWRDGLTREALIEEIDHIVVESSPGGEPAYTQPIQMRFNELLGGSVSDVAVSIFGPDLGELRRLAEEVVQVIEAEPGAVDVRISAPPAVSLVEVRPRALDAAQRGLTNEDVLDAVRAIRTGVDVGVTYEGPLRIPIRMRLGVPSSSFAIDGAELPLADGHLARLDAVADLVRMDAPAKVEHDDAERRIVVGFNVRGRDLGTVVESAAAAVEARVELPPGYRPEWGGQYESLTEARARLAVVVPIVLASIFAVLLWLFRAVRPSLAIFLNVPFAGVGGIVALAARGMPVSISAAIGFIALSGIAVLNGVVLMNRVRSLEEGGATPRDAVGTASRQRMRPVLMTALVAALGFVPMMLATGAGAEVQRPLATVVVGGLVTSTFLTLVILPAIYPWIAKKQKR
jgi:cobalt-zinc-cadmium resistance protein CzcA